MYTYIISHIHIQHLCKITTIEELVTNSKRVGNVEVVGDRRSKSWKDVNVLDSTRVLNS